MIRLIHVLLLGATWLVGPLGADEHSVSLPYTQRLKTVSLPFEGGLTLAVPIDAELNLWKSGIYFWHIDRLQLSADTDKVYKLDPYKLDIVVSEAPKTDFDYARWRQSLNDGRAEIIFETPYGVLYQSGGVLHVLTYLYADKHFLGKAVLFDTQDIHAAMTAFELLSSHIPGAQTPSYIWPFDVSEQLASMTSQSEDLKILLDTELPKHLKRPEILKTEALDGFRLWPEQFDGDIQIMPLQHFEDVVQLKDAAAANDWVLQFEQELGVDTPAGSLVYQSRRNPLAFMSYCFVRESGFLLQLSMSSFVPVNEQLVFVHQCNSLVEGRRLIWLTPEWRQRLFRYNKVESISAPEFSGWFIVWDKANNPDDYLWGAAGVIDNQGKQVLPNTFDEIRWQGEAFVAESHSGKTLLSETGDMLLQAQYISHIGPGFYLAETADDRQGVFDIQRRLWVIPLTAQRIRPLDASGLFTFSRLVSKTASSKRYGMTGLMNANGDILLPDKYQTIWFNPHLQVVVTQQPIKDDQGRGYRYGIFDTQGKQLVSPSFDYVQGEQDEVIKLRKNGQWYQYPAQ